MDEMLAKLEGLRAEAEERLKDYRGRIVESQALLSKLTEAVIGLEAQRSMLTSLITGATVAIAKQVQDPVEAPTPA
jgi:hypothetical protein